MDENSYLWVIIHTYEVMKKLWISHIKWHKTSKVSDVLKSWESQPPEILITFEIWSNLKTVPKNYL